MTHRSKSLSILLFVIVLLTCAIAVSAQADDICMESGLNPSLDSPFAHVPYVFGKISLKGFDPPAKAPKVTVILSNGSHSGDKLLLNSSGNYCFKRNSASTTLIVEVNGTEAARRTLAAISTAQDREDFEVYATSPQVVISSKFTRPPNDKTIELYKKTLDAEAAKDDSKVTDYLKQIVAIDPADFFAWTKLGEVYIKEKAYAEADTAFRRALELRVDYTPAWIAAGQLRVAQKGYVAAIEIFKHATETDPTSAVAFQQLGETYLLNKQGTLGAEALNKAISLDPTGMAECHLQLAHLYELAKANKLAAHEYKLFLTKVPNHPDKQKFEKFVRDNPE